MYKVHLHADMPINNKGNTSSKTKPVTAKLPNEALDKLTKYTRQTGIGRSTFIRDAVLEKMNKLAL
jgi:predicted DNA-binding protein